MQRESPRFYITLVIVACIISLLIAAYASWGGNL
jgi:hypothetical protein